MKGLTTVFSFTVSPNQGWRVEGPIGGPFAPQQETYRIDYQGRSPVSFEVSLDPPVDWLTLTGDLSGILESGSSAQVTLGLSAAAVDHPWGVHETEIVFSNLSQPQGDKRFHVELIIGDGIPIRKWNLNADPGWNRQGLWAYGVPQGLGGQSGSPDPTQGHTGSAVLGYNLNGDYENDLQPQFLTSGSLDLSGCTRPILRFRRWLGVDDLSHDQAAVDISTDGATWQNVWTNPQTIDDGDWTLAEIDLTTAAEHQSDLFLRWSMGPTDASDTFCGWNLDDLEIRAMTLPLEFPQDVDRDGLVTLLDCVALLDLFDLTQVPYDFDQDGTVTMGDLMVLLTTWRQGSLPAPEKRAQP